MAKRKTKAAAKSDNKGEPAELPTRRRAQAAEPAKSPEKRKRKGRKSLPRDQTPVVGVGASAGGVAAYQEFVKHVPAGSGVAWVLIQHMAPDKPSDLTSILGRCTELPVKEVAEETKIEPDHIYVIAPGRTMTIEGNLLKSVRGHDLLARRTSIDAFFLSLAERCGENCGCALLSGAGTDGTLGLKAVREAGGLTITQALSTAEYDSMLLSAVRTGLVDRELRIKNMPGEFVEFLIKRRRPRDEEIDEGVRRRVCDRLRQVTGHDFSGYKKSTVDRRIYRRIQMHSAVGANAYIDVLNTDNMEAMRLCRDLLISVTHFFRDPEAFRALEEKALPQILKTKTEDDEIRVWVPGCATGEEAYSLAMLLHEQADGNSSMPTIRIFGSDIDDNALHFARIGRYPKSIAADMPPARLERYFEQDDGAYIVRSQLREMCLFAQHNMLRDPPFSRIDLISCRNVLIYMNAEIQRRLMPVFHYALRRDGFLFLGPAENANHGQVLFNEIDRKNRLYQKKGETARMPEFPVTPAARSEHGRLPGRIETQAEGEALRERALQRILLEFAPAYVVIDGNYDILEASGGTGDFLELPTGQPRANLAAMARSGLAIDIKAAVAKAMATGERVIRTDLATGKAKDRKYLTLIVERVAEESDGEPLCLVLFQKQSAPGKRVAQKRKPGGDEEVVRALELELQSTKERLQTTLEELETSNEELKASNEELSSVNEELQSSNEELETSKEELHSINEELRAVNNELSNRVDDLTRANNDLKNLLTNTRIAMLFLDRNFNIMNFTPPARELFRLREHDLGRPMDELAGRIDHTMLKGWVREVTGSGKPVEEEVQTNGGDPQTFLMRIMPYRDEEERVRGAVLTFVDITERKHHEQQLSAMVSELNHRVKNSVAAVQAMVRRTEPRAASVEEFGKILLGSLQAMSTAYHILSAESWQRADMEQLAADILTPFATPGGSALGISGPTVDLQPKFAVALGLILFELATNAAKYGAWSRPNGAVNLGWEILRTDSGRLNLAWTEEDGPPVTAPQELGYGLKFVRDYAAYELNAECEYAFAKDGFACRLRIPAAPAKWRARGEA